MTKGVAAIAFVVVASAASAAIAQDRLAVAEAEARRCQNAILGFPQITATMMAAGVSAEALCTCEARITAGLFTPAEGAQIVRGGAFPARLAEGFGLAMKYCLALQ